MPTFGEKDQRFTVAVGPNSPFPRGQPIPIPGLGVGYPSDVGPDVKGIDIPVPRASMRNDPRFNRTVMINGRPVRLTAYPPAAADPGNVDPTGGGNFDASGNRIIMYGGQPAGGTNRLPRWYQPTGTRPPVVLATNELPQPLSGANPFAGPDLTIGRPEVNPPPNENRYPTTVSEPNPAPNENQYPTQINQPSFYNPPINDFNVNPTPNDFYRGGQPYNPPVYENNVPTPIDTYQPTDIYNPAPPESAYPTPAELSNPAPNETMYPTPVGDINPAPNEEMVANPVDMYYPAGDGTYVPLDANGDPIEEDTTSRDAAPEPAPIPPVPSGSVPLPYYNPGPNVSSNIGQLGSSGPGGGYFQGTSNWQPLPGSFTPTSFGGSGIMFTSPFQAGSPTGLGPYGVTPGSGGHGGGGKTGVNPR